MRQFHGLLCLGAGGWSVGAAKLLHERLEEGLSLSGGLQQSSHGEPEDEALRTKLQGELEEVARDLVAALTGRRISFTDHLPYPWEDGFQLCAHGKKASETCLTDERGRPPGCGRHANQPKQAPITFDATGRDFPALFGREGEEHLPPEYLTLAVPVSARLEERPNEDDSLATITEILRQLGATPIPFNHPVFQEAKKRLLARNYVEVRDDKWPFTFQTERGPYRLAVGKCQEPQDLAWDSFLPSMGGKRINTAVEFDLPANPVIHPTPGLRAYLVDQLTGKGRNPAEDP